MKIVVSVDKKNGKSVYLPNCAVAEMLCELLGQKTLTKSNINILRKSGLIIKMQYVGQEAKDAKESE